MFTLQVYQCNHTPGNNWKTNSLTIIHANAVMISTKGLIQEQLVLSERVQHEQLRQSWITPTEAEVNNFISEHMMQNNGLVCVQRQGVGISKLTGAVAMDGILCRVKRAIAHYRSVFH